MDDRMDELFNDLPEPPEDDTDRINPWRRPLRYLSWGIFLTTVTFNFLNLDRLLPAVGVLLMVLAFRPLRRENGGFTAAYWMAVLRLILLFLAVPLGATPFFTNDLAEIMTVPSLILQVAQLVALRAGLAEVFDRAGTPRRLAGVNWFLFFNLVMVLGVLLEVGDMGIFGLALIAGYIAVIVAVARLPGSLGDAGCEIRNAPVRLSDGVFSAVTLGALLTVTLAAWALGLALSIPRAEPFTPAENSELSALLPGEIAEIMTEEDATLFDDAENVQYTWYGGGRNGTLDDQLTVCTVTAQLPHAKILILHYFRWLHGGPRYGDSVSMWNHSVLTRLAGIRSALVYERGGETWTSPLVDLAGGVHSMNSFLGQTSQDLVCGDIYVPLNAQNTRGYVMYEASAGSEHWINYNLQFEYSHRTLLDSLTRPGSPTDVRFSQGFDSKNRVNFLTLFSAWETEETEDDEEYGFHVVGDDGE